MMSAPRLVLSVFPGIDLLGLALEQELPEVCVVRGPDPIFGSLHDIRQFHPPAGVFWGVCGGPPCQAFSPLALLNRAQGVEPRFGDLVTEFERIVVEVAPEWFLMENVEGARLPYPNGYRVFHTLVNNRWVGGEQDRLRRFSFGTVDGLPLDPYLEVVALERCERRPTVTSSTGGPYRRMVRYTVEEAAELQGLPRDFLEDAPFTKEGKLRVIANGVPLPLGRAIARAITRALAPASR